MMKKTVSFNIDYHEDYNLLAIVSPIKDYTLSFFINKLLDLQMKKYDDLTFNSKKSSYPWYYYKQGNKYLSCYLIGNNHPKGKLIPALNNFDYFFLVKDAISQEQIQTMAAGIRGIKNVVGVFSQDISEIKDMDILIEYNEFHEMDQIVSTLAKTKNNI